MFEHFQHFRPPYRQIEMQVICLPLTKICIQSLSKICEQVQSQQARPRLERYSLNKREQDPYSQIFKTETKTRKMCIFETETRKMVETVNESLADLWSLQQINSRRSVTTIISTTNLLNNTTIQSNQQYLLVFNNILNELQPLASKR